MVRTIDILNARVLIVDDQSSHVLLLERMLRDAGYTSVESTTDPTVVCELHRKNRYAAILLDLKMPGMDGFQVMEALKEVDSDDNLPVLVITAEPGHKLRALRAGARDFVSKPLDMPEVLIRVHNMIELRLLRLKTRLLNEQLVDAQKVTS
jgi:DNA-binding response OmpR family regulator